MKDVGTHVHDKDRHRRHRVSVKEDESLRLVLRQSKISSKCQKHVQSPKFKNKVAAASYQQTFCLLFNFLVRICNFLKLTKKNYVCYTEMNQIVTFMVWISMVRVTALIEFFVVNPILSDLAILCRLGL